MKATVVFHWLRIVLIGAILASASRAQAQTQAQIIGPPVPPVPSLTQVVKPGVTLSILGTATGPNFQNYVLEWAPGVTPTSGWSTAGFTLADNGLVPVDLGVLGTWTLPVGLHGDYTLRLTVMDGGVPTFANSFVYAEPGLISPAWPFFVGTFRFDHGAVPVRQPDGTSRLLIGGPRNIFGGGSGMYAYSADGSSVLASLDVGGDAQPAAGNLDGQPGDEVVVADGLSLKIFSSNLALLKTITTPEPRVFWVEQPILADIDGDGIPEIIAVARDALDAQGIYYQQPSPGYLYVFRADGTLYSNNFPVNLVSVLSQYGALGPAGVRVMAVDLNGDGIKEIVVTIDAYGYPSPGYTVRVINGDGTVYPNAISPSYTGFSVDSLSAADLDHDGTPEIVIVETSTDQSTHQIRVLNNDGTLRAGWPVVFSSSITLAIGDLDRNQHNEIVAAANRTLTILRDDGTLWAQPWTIGDGVNDCANTTPLIADIDGDGIPEILLASSSLAQSPVLHRTSFLTSYRRDGSIQQRWPLFGMYGNQPYFAVPVVGDFNGDGKTNLAVTVSLVEGGEVDGLFRSAALTWLTTGTTFNPSASDWTSNYRDPQNSRSVTPPPAPPVPVFTTQPQSRDVAVGGSVTLFAWAVGNPAPSYRWQKNGVNITGATSPFLTLSNVQLAASGTYRAIATNPNGSATSNGAVVTVASMPVMTSQPASRTVNVGANVTLACTVTGTPAPIFQWWKDNFSLIPGATSSSLVLTNVQLTDAGSYRVTASNFAGGVSSNPAILTVNAPPVFTTQPVTQNAIVGFTVTFTAAAFGVPDPTYRWQKNGANISGATSATLTLTNVPLTATGAYRVIATNAAGSATSADAMLYVAAAPAFTTQPVGRTVNAGTNVSLTVAASGTPAPTFQWQKDGIDIPGATSRTLSFTPVQVTDSGSYQAIATNTITSVASNPAVLTVNAKPLITTQPLSQTVIPGTSVVFYADATGTPAPTFQWQKNGANIAGETGTTLSLPFVPVTASGTYRVIVTNAVGSATSVGAVLTVQTPPVITVQPVGRTVLQGATVTFSVTATGSAPLMYQWTKAGVYMDGATNRTLTLTNVQPSDFASYQVRVTNAVDSVLSGGAVLYVNVPPTITTQPMSQAVYAGFGTSLYVIATGTPDPTYRWQKNGVNISGATSFILNFDNPTLASAGTYRVIVTNAAGSVTSDGAVLTVNQLPTFTTQPVNKTVNADTNVTFTAAVTGFPVPTFQWRKDGVDIPGATSASLTLNSVQLADAGSYQVIATNSFGATYSNTVTLVVKAKPVFVTPPASQTVSVGGSAIFTVEVTGFPTPTLKWQKNGVTISGAIGPMYIVNNAQASSAGTYTAVATNSVGVTTSTGAILTVQP